MPIVTLGCYASCSRCHASFNSCFLQFFNCLNDSPAHWAAFELEGAGLAESLVLAGLEHGAGLRVEAEGAGVLLDGQPVQQLKLHVPEKKMWNISSS